MKSFLSNTKHLHFVGIGGIGMSGMAELLHNHGFKISGSDLNKSNRTKHLSNYKNIKISYKHKKENIANCDLLVYSSAINKSNPEIQSAKKNNIPIMKRAELLGELLKIKDISIAVSGTHGKTTTSSMLGSILYEAETNPTLIIGGIVKKFNSNNITGDGDIIVVEADEFDKSFLELSPSYSIINNLDLEHLDCYDNIEELFKCFTQFANSIAFYGKVAFNNDDDNILKIINKIRKPKISFGIKNNSTIQAKNIFYNQELTTFDIFISNTKKTLKIALNCPGEHNVYNALAASTIALELDIPKKHIINGLNNYSGVKRRFDIRYNKKHMIIDDYAHHPNEILETLKAAKNGWDKRIISIFQPHLFSRTNNFYNEFADALNLSDIIIITEIYPAREVPIKGVTSKLIYNTIRNKNKHYISKQEEIINETVNIAKNGDMIIVMGAGNINNVIAPLIEQLDEIN